MCRSNILWTLAFPLISILFVSCGPSVELGEYRRLSGDWEIVSITVNGRSFMGQTLADTTLRGDLGELRLEFCDRTSQDQDLAGCPATHSMSDGTSYQFDFVLPWQQEEKTLIFSNPIPTSSSELGMAGTYEYNFNASEELELRAVSGTNNYAAQYVGKMLDLQLKKK